MEIASAKRQVDRLMDDTLNQMSRMFERDIVLGSAEMRTHLTITYNTLVEIKTELGSLGIGSSGHEFKGQAEVQQENIERCACR